MGNHPGNKTATCVITGQTVESVYEGADGRTLSEDAIHELLHDAGITQQR